MYPESRISRLPFSGWLLGMDKKEINSPRLTANFLIWIGGVFLLLLFAFIAHFVWKIL